MIQFPNTDAKQIQTNIFGFGKAYRVGNNVSSSTGVLENVTPTHIVLINAVVGKEFVKKHIFPNTNDLEFFEISDEEYQELVESTKVSDKKKIKTK